MTLHHGDCLDVMAQLDPDSIDAIVTDPPYELGFMGKKWDRKGVAFQVRTWELALRIAKPGAHLLAFGGTRTYHRLAAAIEDAGWEVRDCLVWAYASGFPKSLDVSKAIDKAVGAEREVIGEGRRRVSGVYAHAGDGRPQDAARYALSDAPTLPATDDAKKWQGWGTALKPAWEPIVLARKPLTGTVAANVQRHGTGALNIDGCRVKGAERPLIVSDRHSGNTVYGDGLQGSLAAGTTSTGRWPANVILTDPIFDGDTDGVVGGGYQESTSAVGAWAPRGAFPIDNPEPRVYGDTGTYSRFFLIPKAARSDREPVLGGGRPSIARANVHPTVKPTELMRHLVRLVTPPGGVVLDPFLGSGTTALACEMEGFAWVGIEREEEYVRICEARLNGVQRGLGLEVTA